MNEVLQINIGNCIITIDKDAYETLSAYLHPLKKYFLTQEDNGAEIYSDIENRIAEIFLEQMKLSKQKASIQKADVVAMIETMGQLSELGVEEESHLTGNASNAQRTTCDRTHTPKQLCKSLTDRKISGVAAGIAQYFGIDPLWVRLLFAFTACWAGVGLIAYIVLAVVLPTDAQPHQGYKKLYRIGEYRVLGGVCTGLATYFDVNLVLVRLIFIAPILISVFNIHLPFISINGFLSVVVYGVLWSVVPLAISSSDLLRVKGEAINLDSLRTHSVKTIKRSHNALDKVLQSFFQLLKVIFKVVALLLFLPLILLIILLSIGGYYAIDLVDFFSPLSATTNQAVIICLIAIPCIPALSILIWGSFVLFKAKQPAIIPIVLSILFFVAISLLGFWGTKVSGHFSKNAEITTQYTLPAGTNNYQLGIQPIHDLNMEYTLPIFADEEDKDVFFHYNEDSVWLSNIRFSIEPTTKPNYYMDVEYKANAGTYNKAQQLAKRIAIPFQIKGDTILLQRGNLYTKLSKYNFEYVECTLYVPSGKSVTALQDIPHADDDLPQNTIYTSEGTHMTHTTQPPKQ